MLHWRSFPRLSLSDSWIKRPTPPDAKGVGSKSTTYPGMQEKDPFSFEFVILVSVTPIMLN